MNSRLFGVLAMTLTGAVSAQAAGFALYGASAKGMAMGGALVGKAADASANFYNPATLSDFTNTVVTAGLCLEIPRANVKVHDFSNERLYKGRLNPGCFYLPHLYVAQPLPAGFTFGLGLAPEFGLGSEYCESWPLNWNSTKTTVEGFVVNPNLAYQITDDWSVSAGLRFLYITFEQAKHPIAAKEGHRVGQLDTNLVGDNGFGDWGWQLSTRYKITESLSAGLMYRSYIDTRVRGHYNTSVRSYDYTLAPGLAQAGLMEHGLMPGSPYFDAMYPAALEQAREGIRDGVAAAARRNNGRAGANIRLPQSISAGLNWDVTETIHVAPALTWTHWSTISGIAFGLEGDDQYVPLNWKDVYRGTIAGAWDFAENWTLMGSYVYDIDPCQTDLNVGSTMLPAGSRHLLTAGLAWHWRNFELSACYGLILMSGRGQNYSDDAGNLYHFSTTAGRSHQVGVSLSYYF